ncbi:hypothetical protein V5O48_013924 [Marasmius crinis-equi]|uniref:CxC1-like cysteine cluster associated with KDZ transposases domain-containing protein n=1 Tax=Marasmius crinis-equi TaxID=585013 RepID=A0ABR3EYQ4_9AGAR
MSRRFDKPDIRAPTQARHGPAHSQARAQIQNYSQRQIRKHKEVMARRIRKRHKRLATDTMDLDIYMEIYNDGNDAADFGHNTEHFDENWEDSDEPITAADEEELRLYHTAAYQYRTSYYRDYRTRRDKIEIDQRRWAAQIEGMTDAFMDYSYRKQEGKGKGFEGEVQSYQISKAVDFFYCIDEELAHFTVDQYKSASIVRQGYFPCNPLLHKSVISIRALELYQHLFVRCPRLSIQPYVRAMCDFQGVRFMNYLCVQFSSAYDAFIAVKKQVRQRVRIALRRDDPDWRSLNNCPSCQYPVAGEMSLEIEFMAAMDGNDSLKRVERREAPTELEVEGRLKERFDPRVGGGDYFVSEDEANRWERTNWPNLDGYQAERVEERIGDSKAGVKKCEERWDNMKSGHTDKEKAIFRETGIFASTCRHMFVLWLTDMIKSGEKRKYALSILHRILTAMKKEREDRNLPKRPGKKAFGYDIGCQFCETLRRSPLEDLAKEENLVILIGLLHAHAHNRLCQLDFLMTYVRGAGLEDLEVLERLFSQSNALAAATRHASTFHRRQMISLWMYHHDNFEAYANLSKFIFNNYRQALGILENAGKVVSEVRALGVEKAEDVYSWLVEEKQFLESRQETPSVEVNKIELYAKLVKLRECRERLDAARNVFQTYDPTSKDKTNAVERTMRQEEEKEEKLLEEVHRLENALDVQSRWKEGSAEWKEAEGLARNQVYQKAIDRVEGLVVARIFELSRLNVSGTGYKMRRHLGKALKTRSSAIQEAVKQYNHAAAKMSPPRQELDYEEVVEATYLSELDFFRETREDVRDKAWAQPSTRRLINEYFKVWRAYEELDRLHVEIQRLVTYMKEERDFLKGAEAHFRATDPTLAYQIGLYRWERGRFDELHRMRLRKIYGLVGFDPVHLTYFKPGRGLKRQAVWEQEEVITPGDDLSVEVNPGKQGEEGWESEGEEEEEEEAMTAATAVLGVAFDR